MSFSLNSAESAQWGEYLFLFVSAATLFLMFRYGHRLGASLRHEPGVPIVALRLFETLGWLSTISAGIILGLLLIHIAPLFFLLGLSSWIYPCIGKTWAAGMVTLGPLFMLWPRQSPHGHCCFTLRRIGDSHPCSRGHTRNHEAENAASAEISQRIRRNR